MDYINNCEALKLKEHFHCEGVYVHTCDPTYICSNIHTHAWTCTLSAACDVNVGVDQPAFVVARDDGNAFKCL